MITDRDGVVLAENTTSYTVFARANAITDKAATARLLATTLSLDGDSLLEKLRSVKASEITVARHVEKSAVETLAAETIEGVYYSRDNTRVYPKGETLCQTLGFTSSDNSGTTGLEKYYERYLAGENGELLYETDLVGVNLKGAVAAYLPAEDGMNIALTIDYGIQALTENALRKVYETYSPVSAECIVLDPNTFEILAIANYPSYDLNAVPRDETELLNTLSRNRIVCDIYEPGSTFKVITAAADLEEYAQGNPNAFSTQYVFSSSRTRVVDGTTVKCWSAHTDGRHCNQTLADALNNSCNPCFTDIALSLGAETFYDYLSAFGFGKATGIDYSGEAIGMLLPESAVRDCDLARIGFGQTVAVSALQLACAVASAINGGYYYTPHLVKKIYASDGYVLQETKKVLKNRTIGEQASSTLASMLEGVVREGSGKKAYIEGYRVGGKTGTAQKYENGHISAGKYVSSFVGFFPADDPQYLALVIVDEPQGAYYGSVVAAPCAKEIFEGIIDLKNIQPSASE
jgi:stage V sporulation protein D (sporulation-specific penicillin-binding protein)